MSQTKEMAVVLTFDDQGSASIKRVIKDLDADLNKLKDTTKQSGQGFEKMKDQVDKSGRAFDRMKSSVKSSILQVAAGIGIWTSASAVISFITRNMRDVVVQGKAFEEAFTRIRVVTRGNTEENDRLRDTLMRMNPALGSVTELTRALAVAMREFKEATRGEQIKFVETAAKVAVAGFTTVETALESLSTVVKSYRMNLSDAAKVGEVLVRATQIESVTFGEVGTSLARLSNTAKLAGVSFAELVGSYLTLAERQTPQLAIMQLRMLLTSLMKTSGPAATEAKRLGIEWSAAGVKAMGFIPWLKKLNQVTAGSSEILDNLVGGGKQMIGMLSLIGSNAKETTEKVDELNKVWNEGGAVQAAFNERLHSTNFLLDTAKELFTRFKVALFQGFSAPLLEGITKQKDFEKRLQEITNRAVDFGKRVGKAIYDLVAHIEKLASTLKIFGQVWVTFFVIEKVTAWTNAMITGLTMTNNVLKGARLAALGLAGAMQLVVQVLGTFIAGYKIGQWLSDITGLHKAVLKIGSWGAGPDDVARLIAMQKLQELTRDTNTSAVKLGAQFSGDYVQALKAVEEGYITLYPRQKTAADIMKESVAYQNALTVATSATVLSEDELAESIEGLTEEQRLNIISINRAKEEMKKYGFTFKTELQDRYAALSLGIKTFRQQMTPEDFKNLSEELKKLGANLGYNNKALVDLNILTKTETNAEVKLLTDRFSGLKKAAEAGIITWENYQIGIDAVNASLKNLGSTVSFTVNGLTKLAELPPPKIWNIQAPGLTVPEYGPSPMLTAKEMKEALASLGPSFALLVQWETALGVPMKTLANATLPAAEAAFRKALAAGEIGTQYLGQAADALIKHFKDAGVEVPKDLANMGSSVTSTWQGVGEAMADYWGNAMAEMIKSGLNFRDVINMTWQTLAIGAGKAIGNMVGKALSSLGAMAGPIGSLVGSIAGSLFSAVGKLFGIKSKAEKEAERAKKAEAELKRQIEATQKAYQIFGKITEETAKKIAEMTKTINSQTAAILTLGDVMNDAGISTKNLSAYLQKMTAALSDIRKGTVDAQKGIDAIGQAFSSLITWAQKFGQEGSKQLIGFIQYLRKLGVEIKEVQDYVFSQLSMGAAGVKAMIEGVGGANYDLLLSYSEQIKTLGTEIENADKTKITDRSAQLALQRQKDQLADLNQKYKELKGTLATELAPELDRVARLTLATFNSFIAQGAGYTEAFAAIKEPLTMLRDKYKELGIEGSTAINDLMKILDVTEANKGLMEALDGNRQVLEALGNTGFLTAENMKDVAMSAQSFYDKLIAGGATAQQALAMISPTLADLEYYSKQYGYALDDNTKRLIDEAKQAGTYKERGKDVVTTLNEGFLGVTDRLDRMLRYYEEGIRMRGDEFADEGDTGGRPSRETRAATTFHGTVTGPRRFYVEPGVTERVDIGAGGQQKVIVVDKQITLEPIVIQLKELEAIIIKYVQKATSDERLIISPKSVRG